MTQPTFTAILALDSFKGSVSALEACNAIEQGLMRAGQAYQRPVKAFKVPVSDGGEGLIDCLQPMLEQQGFSLHQFSVLSPYGQPCRARVLVDIKQHTALIESAEAIGLELTPITQRNALYASSYGLGQLVQQVAALGCRKINIGLGGTATNDCGVGLAQALGMRFFDSQGQDLSFNADGSYHTLCGADLEKIVSIDCSNLIRGLDISCSCDVDNPLCGSLGATLVFGPQKSLAFDDIPRLEQGMQHFASVLTQHFGHDYSKTSGAGAAGGLGAAFLYLFNASLRSGIDMVLDLYNFENLLKQADVVLIGEGCMDGQTARGKAPIGIAARAFALNVPCIALCGDLHEDAALMFEQHVSAMFSIASGPMTLEQSKSQARLLLSRSAENIFRCLLMNYLRTYVRGFARSLPCF